MESTSKPSSRSYLFDIEADGLLDTISKIWCISIKDLSTGVNTLYGPDQIQEGLEVLSQATEVWIHNGLGYDLPALKKVCNFELSPTCVVRDTLLLSYLLFSDRALDDMSAGFDEINELIGSHSLEAWGKRLGHHKMDYQGGFDQYTPEMGEYCKIDVEVLDALRKHLLATASGKKFDWSEAYELEKKFFLIAEEMREHGIAFDVERAERLHQDLQEQIIAIEKEIQEIIPATQEEMKTPDYWEVKVLSTGEVLRCRTRGECDQWRKDNKIKPKDCEFVQGPNRIRSIPFNPNSRPQVRQFLYDKYQWLSPKLTDSGEKLLESQDYQTLAKDYGSLSEEILRDCAFPEGQKFADYFLLSKISSFLSSREGERGWLSLIQDGRIHPKMLTMGCATFRCSHYQPNSAQVPHVIADKVTKEPLFGLKGRFGADCRSLFTASPGYVMVGADLSSIELVCLAHYLYPYDRGKYAKEVLDGDVHMLSVNALKKIAGFTVSRGDSKTCTFGWAYGSGDYKLGLIIVPISPEAMEEFQTRRKWYIGNPSRIKHKIWSKATKSRRMATPDEAAYTDIGNKVRVSLESGIDGLGELVSTLKEVSKNKRIRILDRYVPVRSPHACLNTALQSCACIIMKKWVCMTDEINKSQGVVVHPLLSIHDEWDVECLPEFVEAHSKNCIDGMRLAGESLGIRVPVRGSIKSGKTWLDVH